MVSPLQLNVFFAAIFLVALERFSVDADMYILPILKSSCGGLSLKRQLNVRGVLFEVYCILATLASYRWRSVFVEAFGEFGLIMSESKTETMCIPVPRALATQIVFNATGQQYRQTTC